MYSYSINITAFYGCSKWMCIYWCKLQEGSCTRDMALVCPGNLLSSLSSVTVTTNCDLSESNSIYFKQCCSSSVVFVGVSVLQHC